MEILSALLETSPDLATKATGTPLSSPKGTMCKRTRTGKSTRGQSFTQRELSAKDKVREFGVFNNDVHQGNFYNIEKLPIHPGDIINWAFLATHGLANELFKSINTDPFTGSQWAHLFQINEPVYKELVLGGETRTMSLMELRWRVGLYSERESRMDETRRELNKGETVKNNIVIMGFWPTIGDGDFFMGGTSVKKIRDPRIRLVHRCITTTISGRKESTHWVTAMDLFFLYCIYEEGVTCNIPYWLAQYFKRDKDVT
ncbi:hypothetical protein Tco_1187269 [Tanacetum coccineum]